jgi:hypothetical protein
MFGNEFSTGLSTDLLTEMGSSSCEDDAVAAGAGRAIVKSVACEELS